MIFDFLYFRVKKKKKKKTLFHNRVICYGKTGKLGKTNLGKRSRDFCWIQRFLKDTSSGVCTGRQDLKGTVLFLLPFSLCFSLCLGLYFLPHQYKVWSGQL